MSASLESKIISALIGQATRSGAERQRADMLLTQAADAQTKLRSAEAEISRLSGAILRINEKGADFETRFRTAQQQYEHTLADIRKLRAEIEAKDARIAELETENAQLKTPI